MLITVKEAIENNIYEELRKLNDIDEYALKNGMSEDTEMEVSVEQFYTILKE